MTLSELVPLYLAAAQSYLEPSTLACYSSLARTYLAFCADERDIREWNAPEAQALMECIARSRPLSRSTLSHIRAFFSGVFAHAIRSGHADRNPMEYVRLPRGAESRETHAYTEAEVREMLRALTGIEPAYSAVLIAAYTGLRASELRGLQWQDYDGANLHVRRKVWRGHTGTPKTRASRGSVPCVAILHEHLVDSRPSRYTTVPILANSAGRPADLANLYQRTMAPVFRSAQIKWTGWHGFRRGLATRLHALGVDDLTIQRILRHASVQITQKCYIKTLDESVKEAMGKL